MTFEIEDGMVCFHPVTGKYAEVTSTVPPTPPQTACFLPEEGAGGTSLPRALGPTLFS